jgi:hypothetical protein
MKTRPSRQRVLVDLELHAAPGSPVSTMRCRAGQIMLPFDLYGPENI